LRESVLVHFEREPLMIFSITTFTLIHVL